MAYETVKDVSATIWWYRKIGAGDHREVCGVLFDSGTLFVSDYYESKRLMQMMRPDSTVPIPFRFEEGSFEGV